MSRTVRVSVPIFGRSTVPLGRLGDVARAMEASGEDMARLAIRPAGRAWDAGYTVHRFASAEALAAELAADACRAPGDLGGGQRGMGPARVGWQAFARYVQPLPA